MNESSSLIRLAPPGPQGSSAAAGGSLSVLALCSSSGGVEQDWQAMYREQAKAVRQMLCPRYESPTQVGVSPPYHSSLIDLAFDITGVVVGA